MPTIISDQISHLILLFFPFCIQKWIVYGVCVCLWLDSYFHFIMEVWFRLKLACTGRLCLSRIMDIICHISQILEIVTAAIISIIRFTCALCTVLELKWSSYCGLVQTYPRTQPTFWHGNSTFFLSTDTIDTACDVAPCSHCGAIFLRVSLAYRIWFTTLSYNKLNHWIFTIQLQTQNL